MEDSMMTYRSDLSSKAIRHPDSKPMNGAIGQTMQMFKTSERIRLLKAWPLAALSTGLSINSASEHARETPRKLNFDLV